MSIVAMTTGDGAASTDTGFYKEAVGMNPAALMGRKRQ